ncbi:MAG: GGDEF domain-containing protein [Pseudohongiellaceae bacterium]|nr:GGDEF domain-containing protein [Pseudohongiellaceae bacterium]
MSKRPPEEAIVLTMCAICLMALAPFALIRFLRGDYLTFVVDGLGAVFALVSIIYILKTHNFRLVGFFLAFVSLFGMAVNVYALGARDIYFLYPIFISSYLVTSPRVALSMCSGVILVISLRLIPELSLFEYAKILFSLLACVVFAYVFATQRNRQRDMLTKLSTEDALTGAGNRRGLHARVDQLVASYGRNNEDMALILLDLDNFKQLNDREGHQAGDRILKQVSRIIESRIRVTDSHYRYGGDEFIILASRANLETATQLAEEIRQLIVEQLPAFQTPITVSIGVAQYRTGEKPDAWMSRADKAMYSVKSSGKNAVSYDEVNPQLSLRTL